MKSLPQYRLPRIALATIAVALLVVQWFCGDFPLWLFSAPMNLLVGALWIALLWEGYRRRASLTAVQYLLSPEASYIALAVATLIAATLGLQSDPTTTSWLVVGGFIYVQSVLILVILRGWRNENGIRWRFLATHCGLWLAVTSALLGAPDKEILRAEVGKEPTREVINEEGKKSYLNYELRLDNFVVENSEDGTPQMFRASVAIDDKIVDIEVNSPYSQRYGEEIYLVSYDAEGCILQIVREPWRIVTATGIAMGEFISFIFTLLSFIKLRKTIHKR